MTGSSVVEDGLVGLSLDGVWRETMGTGRGVDLDVGDLPSCGQCPGTAMDSTWHLVSTIPHNTPEVGAEREALWLMV